MGLLGKITGSDKAAAAALAASRAAAAASERNTQLQLDFAKENRDQQRDDIFGTRDTWLQSQQDLESQLIKDNNNYSANLRTAMDETGAGQRGYLQDQQDQRLNLVTGERTRQYNLANPYIDAGAGSLDEQGNLAGSPLNVDITQDPGYQFRMSEGLKTIGNQMGSKGMRLSGASIKANQRFVQGLASQEYGNAYTRAQNLRTERLSMLSGLSRLGQNTAGQQSSVGANLTGVEANSVANQAGTVSNYAGAVVNNAGARQDAGNIYSQTMSGTSGVGSNYSNQGLNIMQTGSANQIQSIQNQGAIKAQQATAGFNNAMAIGNVAASFYGGGV